MNKEWSELNKTMQLNLKKKDTFADGIETLLVLRKELMKQVNEFKSTLTKEQFSAMPFANADGYHSKTIAYSLYHIFRIEDIVANIIIAKSEDLFTKKKYQERMNSSICTTGNELVKEEIVEFSKQLDLEILYEYIQEVDEMTTRLLQNFTYDDLKKKYDDMKEIVQNLGVVSQDETAVWLIDYWCDKNLKGLIQMPFSRHWIMHIEASMRIMRKICK